MLLLPAAAATAMFTIVHLEGRFLAGYIVVAWTVLYASLATGWSSADHRWTRAALAGVVAILSLDVIAAAVGSAGPPPRDERVASAMTASGVPGRSELAVFWPLGVAKSYGWARLGRYRIVAETEIGGCAFWALPPDRQR